MVEHLSVLLEDGCWMMEVFLRCNYNFRHPALGFLPYFNNFFISSIKISLSGWYFPFNLGIVPSLSS